MLTPKVLFYGYLNLVAKQICKKKTTYIKNWHIGVFGESVSQCACQKGTHLKPMGNAMKKISANIAVENVGDVFIYHITLAHEEYSRNVF